MELHLGATRLSYGTTCANGHPTRQAGTRFTYPKEWKAELT